MNRLTRLLPKDWIFQLVSLSLITSFSFFLFKFARDVEFVTKFWYQNEKYYIYTFLSLQFLVKVVFYWLLFLCIKMLLFDSIKRKILTSLEQHKTRQDLKSLSELKQILAKAFGLPLRLGLINKSDFDEKIEIENKAKELDDIMTPILRWICVIIHLFLTLILVYQFNAWYLIPFLILILIIVVVFWTVIVFVIGNAEFIEKVRKEISR